MVLISPSEERGDPLNTGSERALTIIKDLGIKAREFIKSLPIPSSIKPLDVPGWKQSGLIGQVGRWCVLTARGGNHAATRDLNKDDIRWLQVLEQVPARNILSHLENEGIVENSNGFPVLTAFGQNLQARIGAADRYMANNWWRLPTS